MLGGGVSAAGFWLAGRVIPTVPPYALAGLVSAVALLGLARDLGIEIIQFPENRRLVPRAVLDQGPLAGPLQFGFEMGTGVRTYVSSSAPYVVALVLLLSSAPFAWAFLTGAGFGIGRWAMPIARWVSRADERWDRRLESRLRVIVLGSGTVCAASAVGLVL